MPVYVGFAAPADHGSNVESLGDLDDTIDLEAVQKQKAAVAKVLARALELWPQDSTRKINVAAEVSAAEKQKLHVGVRSDAADQEKACRKSKLPSDNVCLGHAVENQQTIVTFAGAANLPSGKMRSKPMHL